MGEGVVGMLLLSSAPTMDHVSADNSIWTSFGHHISLSAGKGFFLEFTKKRRGGTPAGGGGERELSAPEGVTRRNRISSRDFRSFVEIFLK